MRIETLKIRTLIGIGYWKDIYSKDEHGIEGYCYNVFFLFWHYQLAYLQEPERKERKRSGFQGRLEAALREQQRVRPEPKPKPRVNIDIKVDKS